VTSISAKSDGEAAGEDDLARLAVFATDDASHDLFECHLCPFVTNQRLKLPDILPQ
jgi:hypothetical protein